MNESNDNSIDIELQVRLLNLVLGEASDFERDQMQQLMEQRPELVTYFRHLEHLHGLVAEVSVGKWVHDDNVASAQDNWQLSQTRRQQLLAVLDGDTLPIQPPVASTPPKNQKKWLASSRWKVLAVTGCAATLLLAVLLLPGVTTARRSNSRRWVASEKMSESVDAAAAVDSFSSEKLYDADRVATYQPLSRGAPQATGGLPGLNNNSPPTNTPILGTPPEIQLKFGRFEPSSPSVVQNDRLSVVDDGLAAETGGFGMGGGMPEGGSRRGRDSEIDAGARGLGRSDGLVPSSAQAGGMGGFLSGQNSASTLPTKPSGPGGPDFAQPLAEQLSESRSLGVEQVDSNFAADVPQFGGFAEPKKQAREPGLILSVTPRISVEEESPFGIWKHSLEREPTSADSRERVATERSWVVASDELTASVEPFSTFSLHVSDVSFKLAQESLSQGKLPEPESVRIEEFVNAMDYRDPLPGTNQKVSCQVEQAIHPFLMQRNLLRVSMRTSALGRDSQTPLRLTLLLDNSGSMERPDRRQIVQSGLQSLVQQLTDSDQVTVISFANSPRLLADKVLGGQGQTLLQNVKDLPSEGGTNIEAALLLAGEKALEQRTAGAQNRIVLLTDGAVNLGDADPNRLAGLVTQLRDLGIAFDAAGVSSHGLNDQVLEALTRQGDGRYYLLDSVDSARTRFSDQIAGAFRPTAKDVKVQVEFNPKRIGRYQLLGFEKHRLMKEDFRNDAVDAAELAAAESGVAVYHFEAQPNGAGDVGSVSVRFQDQVTGEVIEQRWPIPYEPNVPRLDRANPSLKIASVAALLAVKLRGGPQAETVNLDELNRILLTLPPLEANQPRVQQLYNMIQQTKGIL